MLLILTVTTPKGASSMEGLTDFITQYRWEDIFTVWFVLTDDAHSVLEEHFGSWRRRGPEPIFADSEVITVALIADTFFGGREDKTLSFIGQYHLDMFPHLPSFGRFNTRRRALNLITEQVRRVVVKQWGLMEDENGEYVTTRLTDSAPIPVCTYTRAKLNRTIEQTCAPRELYFGVSSSKKTKVFGFRLHMDTSLEQVVDRWLLAPACMHDSQCLRGMYEEERLSRGALYDLMLIGDGAFNNPDWLRCMRHKHGSDVRLWAVPRQDSRTPWPEQFRRLVSRVRRRIETAFSVLSEVFNLERPASRSLSGLVSRVSTRMLAFTLAFITGPLLALLGFQTRN
jgi:hypothetical protein